MNPAPRLFSYTIPIDDGAAPNPFHGMCTLAICKPGIRRVAKKGDWVAGLGSINAPCGRDLSGHLIYAMLVEDVRTLREYDELAIDNWPHRIPRASSPDLSERLGDCIYDFSTGNARQRSGVHGKGNIKTDLSGVNVLISRIFYYFGNRAKKLPADLSHICHQTQGHRSDSNAQYFGPFVEWIQSLTFDVGMHGWPDYLIDWQSNTDCGCNLREADGERDVPC